MKRYLIGTAIFVLGLLIGAAAAGLFVKKIYTDQAAKMYSMSVGADALLAQQLRAGLADIILEATDRRIVTGVVELHQNPQLKDLWTTEVALAAAKEYYTCAKLEFPPEIAHILNDSPPVPADRCPSE
jgi:hypothetical protein